MPAGVELDVKVDNLDALVRRLESTGVKLGELDFSGIAKVAARVVRSFAPKGPSGKLARSVRPNRTTRRAVVKVGGARVPYAGLINYGWPQRHIKPSKFLQRADLYMRYRAPAMLERQIKTILRSKGLT